MREKILIFIKRNWGIPVILTLGLISLTWFGGKDYLLGDDTNLFISLKKYSLLDEYFTIWSYKFPYYGLSTLHFPFLMPLGFILKIFQELNLPFSGPLFQRLLVYYILTACGLSMYALFSLLFRSVSPLSKTIAALTYMFSFYVLQLWNSMSLQIFIYAFFPLLFALYAKWISEKRPIRYAVVLALVFFVTITPGFMSLPFVPIYFGVVLGYFLFKLLLAKSSERKNITFFFLVFIFVWFFLNFFWLFPPLYLFKDQLAVDITPGYGAKMKGLYKFSIVPIKEALFFQGNAIFYSLTSELLGSHVFPWASIYQNEFFRILALLIPLISFVGFFGKWDKNAAFFKLVIILSLLFACSETIPYFGKAISDIFIKFKIIYIYRNVYHRFIPLYVFSLLVFFGLGWEKIYRLQLGKRLNTIKNMTLLSISFLVIFVYVFPFWTGKIHETEGMVPSKKITFPAYIQETVKWLENQEGDYTILPLPHPKLLKNTYWWNNGHDGYQGIYPLYYLSSKQFLGIDAHIKNSLSSLVSQIYNESIDSARRLNIFNIRYIILHHDNNPIYLSGKEPSIYTSKEKIEFLLKRIDGLNLVKEFGPLSIYENIYWFPTLFYCAKEKDIPIGDQLRGEIMIDRCSNIIKKYKMINPTKYLVEIEVENPTKIVFNNLYNRHWEMQIRQKTLKSQPYNEIFNSFTVSMASQDKIDAVVEFKPQKILYIGWFISGVTLFGCIGYLVYDWRKKRGKASNYLSITSSV